MPTTTQSPQVPGGNANVDEQLRTSFDLLGKQVADLELMYRNIGLAFFVLPVPSRPPFFGSDIDDANAVFLRTVDGSTSQVAQLLNSLRPALDEIRAGIHRLGSTYPRDEEFDAAEKMLKKANRVHDRANASICPLVDEFARLYPYTNRNTAQRLLSAATQVNGAALPEAETDERYADFCAWALTVRDVQNLIRFGNGEDEAIASLTPEMVETEERIVPSARHLDYGYVDPTGEVSDDDYFTESDGDNDDSSSASNPWEDTYDDTLRRLGYLDGGGVPVGNGREARPNMPPPAFQFR